MKPRLVQYKGYRIEAKYYPAFEHCHRTYLAKCDYSIFDGDEKVYKGYDLGNVEDAITEAKEYIDKIGPCPVCGKKVEENMGRDT